jgi:predicted amidophosphoribosyltransferase
MSEPNGVQEIPCSDCGMEVELDENGLCKECARRLK